MKYIQFIGTQRSGSNLLRVMLNQLPEISAPHPPHILKTFFPLIHLYGDLNNPENFYSLVSDVCEWVNQNPVPWEDLTLVPDKIFSLCNRPTLVELFSKIYEQKASHDHSVYWCCKSMESIYYVDQIEKSGLRPVYIYIYRDGRDVALSFKKAMVGPKHIYHLAKKWRKEQELSLQLINSLAKERYVVVKYEELILHPHSVIKEVCDKLNIPFSENIFDYFHSHESFITAKSGKMWQNLLKPIMTDNFNKFKKELTTQELEIFEGLAGEMLIKLGYEPVLNVALSRSNFSEEEIAKFNSENDLLKKQALAQSDPDELSHRLPQEELLRRIQNKNILTK